MPQIDGKQIKNLSIKPAQTDFSGATLLTHPATRQYVQDQITSSVFGVSDWKQSVRAGTTANITLSGIQTIDGVSLTQDDRVLVKNQTVGFQNGIYLVKIGAWQRAPDANTSAMVTPGMVVTIESGTTQAGQTWRLSNTSAITLDTTALTFVIFSTTYYATPVSANKYMDGVATGGVDNVKCCNTGITLTPAQGSYIDVRVNGISAFVGNATKTGVDCYFSTDGTTALAYSALAGGNIHFLYWVQSTAGYDIATTDKIDFHYVN